MESRTGELVADYPEVRPLQGAKVIDTGAARWWFEDGILYNRSYVDGDVTPRHLRDGFAAARELSNGRPAPLIAVAGPFRSAPRESRDLLAGPEAAAVYAAMGVLISSPVARVIMNLFIQRSLPLFSARVFTSAPLARTWARSFVTP